MQFEITIEGDSYFLELLSRRVDDLIKQDASYPLYSYKTRYEGGRFVVLAGDPESLDRYLLTLSRLINEIEKELSIEDKARLIVRNLSYCEPSITSTPPLPLRPVSSLTIWPWKGGTPETDLSGTILLDSEWAFGSGTHPTTSLCLEFLQDLSRGNERFGCLKGKMVLDFGCGTGILAIAAARLGAGRVKGVEIDAEAAETAKRNVSYNGFRGKITIINGSVETLDENYDLILANIVAAAHVRIKGRLAEHLCPGGRLLITGFGPNQSTQMEHIYDRPGLEVCDRREKQGWCAVLLRRP